MLRRSFLKSALAWPLPVSLSVASNVSWASLLTGNGTGWRKALIVGNGSYQKPHDLPSAAANVETLARRLIGLGFEVSAAVDLTTAELTSRIKQFIDGVQAAPAESVNLVYFVGHGVQAESKNYLLGIDIEPTLNQGELVSNAFNIEDQWIGLLPKRQDCLQVAIIDACRTDATQLFDSKETGLNQIEAPPGSIVSFSTQAGRPAVAPADANKLTFYTQALVDQLMELDTFSTFGDLLRLVKQRVYKDMRAHPLPLIQAMAQDPFIAENTMLQLALQVDSNQLAEDEQSLWRDVLSANWPPSLLTLLDRFLSLYPNSPKRAVAKVYLEGAQRALSVLKQPSIQLYKSSFVLPEPAQDINLQADLAKSARGDKDAAARIARSYGKREEVQSQLRYEGWLQFASGLGNGIAAYELALLYRELNLPQPAASAEAKAVALGYVPPRGLSHDR